jgi:hypothetical protein
LRQKAEKNPQDAARFSCAPCQFRTKYGEKATGMRFWNIHIFIALQRLTENYSDFLWQIATIAGLNTNRAIHLVKC